eukprot:TRINITY_DN18494_c0_g1_i1.p1 TRINITY_DN18494_c0_g1~~TRINITY_DN18494_c0_g1_i1.p1  ORF type:complete len:257 (-),score=53.05 TRINITY_DN18494_c0_g1_i1:170-940(-)
MVAPLCNEIGITKQMYVCGGFDGTERLDSLFEYDFESNHWSEKAAPGTRLWGNSLVGHDRTLCLWSLGGYDGHVCENTVRIYSKADNNWRNGPPLPTAVHGGTACIMRDSIFRVAGSVDGGQHLDSGECLNLSQDDPSWIQIKASDLARYRPGSAAIDDKWYVVGGYSLPSGISHRAQCYDPQADKWMNLPHMLEKRSGPGVTELDGQLIVVGGYNTKGARGSMEALDPREGKWHWVSGCELVRDGPGMLTSTVLP